MKLSVLLLLGVAVPAAAQTERYDLLIRGGTVVDGTGAPRFIADVAVRNGRIVAVSATPLPRARARRVINATGQIVAPGFIDLHAHLEPLLNMPDAESAVRMGVTTALGGPDGGSPWPIGDHLAAAERRRLGINFGLLVGHNTVRRAVIGAVDRAPTPEELERMRGMVARAMGEGAFGISTGLAYVPGVFSETDEVIALSRVAADSGGIYTSHMRDEARGLMQSVEETIRIGREARLPVVITHAKAVGRPAWGRSADMLAAVDAARAQGVDVMLDLYPYTASHTGIGILVPSWALAGGDSAFQRRSRDPALRDSLVAGIIDLIENERGGGDLRFVQFSRVSWDRSLEGRTMADWARSRGLEPSPRVGADLVIEALQRGGAQAVYHVMHEDDVRRIMRHPMSMIASDARLNRLGDGHPHPRAYGTFPRILGRYVRQDSVLTLEQAVHKMSGMPARRLGLDDRGRIAAGAAADVVVFNPATVSDRATFDTPHRWPAGINWVVVNGVITLTPQGLTRGRGGRPLRRPARSS
jgi:N-acyl-D-aspartate/D-glutamate deacylase